MVVLKNMLRKDSNIYNFIVFQKCPDFQNFANFFPKLVKSGIPEPFCPTELSVKFSRTGKFSSSFEVVSESLKGLKLVAFFVAAQHLCIAFYEDDPDFSIYMGQLRSVTKVVYAKFCHNYFVTD